MRIYLAGPDVFLPNAREVGAAKQALCRAAGHEGLFPLDEVIDTALPPAAQARAIFANCVRMMERGDAMLANLTPFRGVSADVGTAFELGWFAAREKPIVGYSSEQRDLASRVRAGEADDFAIEDFGWPDNLMLPGAIEAAGGAWITRPAPLGEELAAMAAFEAALLRLTNGG